MVTYGYYGNSEEKLQSADRCKKKNLERMACVYLLKGEKEGWTKNLVCDTVWCAVSVLSYLWLFVTPWTPPGSSIHGDSPSKNTGVVAMPSCRGSSQSKDRIQVSCIVGEFFTSWANNTVWCYLENSSDIVRKNKISVGLVLTIEMNTPA